jgi:hypothetical protein
MVNQRENFNDPMPHGFAFKRFRNSNGRRMGRIATVQISSRISRQRRAVLLDS